MADYHTRASLQPPIPKHLITDAETEFLALFGFDAFSNETHITFGAYEYCASNEDSDGIGYEEEHLSRFLQALIKSSKGELTWISIEFAYTCSKFRPDAFGGAATFITADDDTQWTSTYAWLQQRIGEMEGDTND